MADEHEVLARIRELVDAEHDLRRRAARGEVDRADEHTRLEEMEQALDQCWDLLRQRRARQVAGQDPEQASVRTTSEVEGYLS